MSPLNNMQIFTLMYFPMEIGLKILLYSQRRLRTRSGRNPLGFRLGLAWLCPCAE